MSSIWPPELYDDYVADVFDQDMADWQEAEEERRRQEEEERAEAERAAAEAFAEWEAQQAQEEVELAERAAAALAPPPEELWRQPEPEPVYEPQPEYTYTHPLNAWQNQTPTPSMWDARSAAPLAEPTQYMPYDYAHQQPEAEPMWEPEPVPLPVARPSLNPLQDYAWGSATRNRLDPETFLRQIGQESGWSPDVISGQRRSSAGATGIGQFIPSTAAGVAGQMNRAGYQTSADLIMTNAQHGLDAAAFHMRALLDQYGGNYREALAAYNGGPRAVQQLRAGRPFQETSTYLQRVLGGTGPVPLREFTPQRPDLPPPAEMPEFPPQRPDLPPPVPLREWGPARETATTEEANYVTYQGQRYPVYSQAGGEWATDVNFGTPSIPRPEPVPEPELEPTPQPLLDEVLGPAIPEDLALPQQWPEPLGPAVPEDFVPTLPEQREIQERGDIPSAPPTPPVQGLDQLPPGHSLGDGHDHSNIGETVVGTPPAGVNDATGWAFPIQGYTGQVALHWGSHAGAADLFAPAGSAVVAARGGRVTGAGYNQIGGNYVMIRGDDGLEYYYAHLQNTPAVRTGQNVGAGTYLGGVGDTGNAKGTGAHLHFGAGRSILNGTGPAGGAGSEYDAVGTLRATLAGTQNRPVQAAPAQVAALENLQIPARETPAPQVPDEEQAYYEALAEEALANLPMPEEPRTWLQQVQDVVGPAAGAVGETLGDVGESVGDVLGTVGRAFEPTDRSTIIGSPEHRAAVMAQYESGQIPTADLTTGQGVAGAIIGPAVTADPYTLATGGTRRAVEQLAGLEDIDESLRFPVPRVPTPWGPVGPESLTPLDIAEGAANLALPLGIEGLGARAVGGVGRAGQAAIAAVNTPARQLEDIAGALATPTGYRSLPDLPGGMRQLESGLIVPGGAAPTGGELYGPVDQLLSTVGDVGGSIVRHGADARQYLHDLSPETAARVGNLRRLDVGDDIVATMVRTVEENPELVDAARRGVITHETTLRDAQLLGRSVEDFLSTPIGQALNEVEMTALRLQAIKTNRELITRAADIAEAGGIKAVDPITRLEFERASNEAARLTAIRRGASATAGRTLSAHNITINELMAQSTTTGVERTSAFENLGATVENMAGRVVDAGRRNGTVTTTPGSTEDEILRLYTAREILGRKVADPEAPAFRSVYGADLRNPESAAERTWNQAFFEATGRPVDAADLARRQYAAIRRDIAGAETAVQREWRLRTENQLPNLSRGELAPDAAAQRAWDAEFQRQMELPGKERDAAIREANRAADAVIRQAERTTLGAEERIPFDVGEGKGSLVPENRGGPPTLQQRIREAERKWEDEFFAQTGQAPSPQWLERRLAADWKAEDVAANRAMRGINPSATGVAADVAPSGLPPVRAPDLAERSINPADTEAAFETAMGRLLEQSRGLDAHIAALENGTMTTKTADQAMRQAVTASEREWRQAWNRVQSAEETTAATRARQMKTADAILERMGGTLSPEKQDAFIKTILAGDEQAAAAFLRNYGKQTWLGRLDLLRYAGMLSSTRSHLLNLTSNLVQGGLNVAETPVMVALDVARARVTGGEREVFFRELSPQLADSFTGLMTGLRNAGVAVTSGIGTVQQSKLDKVLPGFQSGSAKLDAAAEMPLRLLVAGDEIGRGMANASVIGQLAARQAAKEGLEGAQATARTEFIKNNLPEFPAIVEQADKLVDRVVLQEKRVGVSAIQHAVNVIPGARIIMPFVRTPLNVAMQMLELQGLAYWQALHAAAQAHGSAGEVRRLTAMLKSEGIYNPNAPGLVAARAEMGGHIIEAEQRAARGLIGTGIFGFGMFLGANGMANADRPTEEGEQNVLPPGWIPSSIRVGGTDVDIHFLGPGAGPLNAGIKLGVMAREGKTVDQDALTEYLASLGKFALDQSSLVGMNNAIQAVTQSKRYGEAFLENIASQAVPYGAGFRQWGYAFDQPRRLAEGPGEAIQAAIPGLNQSLPPARDVFGQPEHPRTPTGLGAFISPVRYSEERDEPILQELRRIGAGIGDVDRTVNGQRLSAEQYDRLRELTGQEVKRDLEVLLSQSPSYREAGQRGDTGRQRELAESVVRVARAAGREAAGIPEPREPDQPWKYLNAATSQPVQSVNLEQQIDALKRRLDGADGREARAAMTTAQVAEARNHQETPEYKRWDTARKNQDKVWREERKKLFPGGDQVTRFEPRVWGEHLNATERVMVDELIRHFRTRSEETAAVEVRRTTDGQYRLYAVERRVLDPKLRRVQL